MSGFLFWSLPLFVPLISGYVYDITVLRSEELEDVADKVWGLGTSIDVYVLVYGYGTGGEDKVLTQRTSTINNEASPEWNEVFRFDDESDGNGAYEKFLFKLYDDDSITGYDINAPDYLGETDFMLAADITNCDDVFSQQMPLKDAAGYLFVEITKYGCESKATAEYLQTLPVEEEKHDGDCLVGDIMYQNGQRIGVQGDTCLDDTKYSGTESICIDAQVKEVEYFGDCASEYEGSECHQQGKVGERFAAVCLKGTEEEKKPCLSGDIMYSHGDSIGVIGYHVVLMAIRTEKKPCLSGDIMYSHGDSIGVIGYTCSSDGNTYEGTQSFCDDGSILELPYTGDCDKEYEGSSCCQQGAPGTWGGAVCITRDCVEYDGKEDGDCLVGDIMYQNGDSIGIQSDTCLDDEKYSGTESICNNGKVEEAEYFGDCGEDSPGSKCHQQGEVGERFAAVCLKDTEEEKKQCLIGDIMYSHGDSIGVIGYTCSSDGNAYEGSQSFCDDGSVLDLPYTGDCDKEYEGSSCCQQGAPGTLGGAVCIKRDCVEYDEKDEKGKKDKKKRRLLDM
eukprot:CAMPEP_0197072892 /NCGR_PEP_ID=MMETSP1384-20130603/210323_1 /TAXON_ID=29189 /ORGANISM="Ammonia sp." /LENGTH=560 /DNA_ID=CAMNT_0042511713 /DNA_START=122 /DNA_END=1805 /DNA_ORIENTATION=+